MKEKLLKEIFGDKKANPQKLKSFGFVKNGKTYEYQKNILDGIFCVKLTITNDKIDVQIIENENNEPYILVFTQEAQGSFVGKVRKEVESFLRHTCDLCFDENIFKNKQTKDVIEYIENKYGDKLEFLWEKFSKDAICRRKDNKKWYALFVGIKESKVFGNSEKENEFLILRGENVESLFDNISLFPAYHMNKKNWFTILLNGSLPNEMIYELLDKSYILAKKK